MSELHEKLESGIVAYLKQYVDGDPNTAASYWPSSLKNDAGQLRIFTGESDDIKDGQAILCISEDANQEEPQFTGNFMVPIQIWLRTPVKVLTAKEVSAQVTTALEDHAAAAGILSDALNQDPFALAGYINSGANGATIMGGIMDLKPMRAEQPNWFASGWSFRVYAMNSTKN